MPTSCEPTITPVATITIKFLSDQAPDYDALPATEEAIVCACLKEGEKKPSVPAIILTSSGNARLDEDAESVMNRFSAKRWDEGIAGCAAYKVRIRK
jgi:hypothetical protein